MNTIRALFLSLILTAGLQVAAIATLGLFGFLFIFIAPPVLGFLATAFLAVGRRQTFATCAAVAAVAGGIVFAACLATHLNGGMWFIPGAEVGALPAFVVFHRRAV